MDPIEKFFTNRCCEHREKYIIRKDLDYELISKLPESDREYIVKKIL
jgi:hypothetical protein